MYAKNPVSGKNTQSEKGLYDLRRKIIAGHWPATTKLREVPLAKELGISRTPLRAALLQLAHEGLLERTGAGYTVRAFSIEDAFVAIELRGVMEGTAARIAAEQAQNSKTMAAIKNTVRLIDDMLSNQAVEGYSLLNDKFHNQLVGLARSEVLQESVDRVNQLPFAAPSAFSTVAKDLKRFESSVLTGQTQHHAMVQAIERGEGSRAEHLAREHAYLAKLNVEEAYKDRENNLRQVPQLALVVDTSNATSLTDP